MERAIYSGAAALRASEQRLEAVASNLANVSTPAFKRRTSATRAFQVRPGDARGQEQARTIHTTDFSQGPLRKTGNPMHLALEGDGFFAVEAPAGEEYTRNGTFALDADGVLITLEGHPVAWDGPRGRIDPVGEAIAVDSSGAVHQGGQQVGRLRLVSFERLDTLEWTREGRFQAPLNPALVPATAEVRQGALEAANTQAVDELVELIAAQRSHESAAAVMQMVARSYERLLTPR